MGINAGLLETLSREPKSTMDFASHFADTKPSWDLIVEMSEAIIMKYVANTRCTSRERRKSTKQRDKQFENQTFWNHDELHYLELSHAMNAGDIGQVEATFLPWIYMFTA